MAEWLRRWTRNPLGSPRAGSNPADYVELFSLVYIDLTVIHKKGNISHHHFLFDDKLSSKSIFLLMKSLICSQMFLVAFMEGHTSVTSI